MASPAYVSSADPNMAGTAPSGGAAGYNNDSHRVAIPEHAHRPITRTPSSSKHFDTAFNYNKEFKVVHREQVANPAPLGLFAFGLTTALLQGGNTAITEGGTRFFVYSFALFFGGLGQFLAGMWEFKRQNTFGATAFSSYGAFWMSFAIFGILVSAGIFEPVVKGEKMLLSLWGIYTFILAVPTLELNFALFLLFMMLSILFFLLTAGLTAVTWTRIGGWWGLVVAGIAWYIAAADLINEEYGMTVLPLGKWSVGRPMARACRQFFGKIPLFKLLVRASKREDRMSGYSPMGKKGSNVDLENSDTIAPVGYEEERRTGHPYLYTASNINPSSFEGDARARATKTGDVRSAVGPF